MKKNIKATDFIPLYDNLIVSPIKLEERGQFGQFVSPQDEEKKTEVGKVVAVANPIKEDFMVGDIILFNRYSPTKIDIGDEMIIKAEDVVAKLK